ncbi:fatty acid desaturase family protein [Horticoccus sp. 23ND18S-11]|uniref:fatty acid desaturase family protein n=1 Tax=Horticoccus sp. 23ND18S-11 TaxID=3391832 RepID=UPI0039C995B3
MSIPHSRALRAKAGTDLILATKPFAKDDPWRSWWAILSTGFLLIGALAGTLWLVDLPARLVCSVLAGLLLTRSFVIYHDQQHHAILPRSRLAEGLMQVFGLLALSPSSVWRSSHNHHHNHNSKLRGSHIGSYPIMTTEQFKRSSRSRRFGYLFVRHPLTILCGYVFMFLYGMCVNPFLNRPARHWDCLLAIVVHFAISAALVVYGGWTTLLVTQILPHFILHAIGAYFFYAQHNFPGVSFKDKDGWTYEKAALESSSFLRTGPVVAWFTANIGYHHIHHLNARIPFYRLPEVLRAIPELQSPKTTSLHPADIVRCLRLKVWDVETQRMVGVSGL